MSTVLLSVGKLPDGGHISIAQGLLPWGLLCSPPEAPAVQADDELVSNRQQSAQSYHVMPEHSLFRIFASLVV